MLIFKKCMHLTTLPKAFYHSSNFGPFFFSLKTNHLISVLLRTVGPLHYQIFFLFFASLWHFLCPNYFLTLSFPSLFTIHVVIFLLGFVSFFFSLALPVVNRVSEGHDRSSNCFSWVLTFLYSPKPALRSLRFAYSVASSFSFPSPSHSLHIFHFPYKVLFLLFWLQKPIDHSNNNVCFSWAHKRSYSYSLNLTGNFPIQMGNTCKQSGMSWS